MRNKECSQFSTCVSASLSQLIPVCVRVYLSVYLSQPIPAFLSLSQPIPPFPCVCLSPFCHFLVYVSVSTHYPISLCVCLISFPYFHVCEYACLNPFYYFWEIPPISSCVSQPISLFVCVCVNLFTCTQVCTYVFQPVFLFSADSPRFLCASILARKSPMSLCIHLSEISPPFLCASVSARYFPFFCASVSAKYPHVFVHLSLQDTHPHVSVYPSQQDTPHHFFLWPSC